MRKILYSPGFGAGWTSWASGSTEFIQFMLTYSPIIEAIERGESMSPDHPAVIQFQQEAKDKFKQTYVCVLGAEDLKIAEVTGPIRIEEYDGSESYVEAGTEEYL